MNMISTSAFEIYGWLNSAQEQSDRLRYIIASSFYGQHFADAYVQNCALLKDYAEPLLYNKVYDQTKSALDLLMLT